MQTAVELTPKSVAGDTAPVSTNPQTEMTSRLVAEATGQVTLSPAEWARQVLGITAPFGHDHLPTVWG